MSKKQKFMEIQPGYRVVITSWENDADNYKTATLEGISLDEVKFIVDLCKLHYSHNNQKKQKVFGNMYDPDQAEREEYFQALGEVVDKYAEFDFVRELIDDDMDVSDIELAYDGVRDYLSNLELIGSEDFYTRVFDEIKVYYIPTVIKLQDVTEEFM